jgi:hypothetical protein
MTRDQIDDLMLEHGIVVVGEAVYALVQLVIERERDECAKVCETMGEDGYGWVSIAAAIRARGKQ